MTLYCITGECDKNSASEVTATDLLRPLQRKDCTLRQAQIDDINGNAMKPCVSISEVVLRLAHAFHVLVVGRECSHGYEKDCVSGGMYQKPSSGPNAATERDGYAYGNRLSRSVAIMITHIC